MNKTWIQAIDKILLIDIIVLSKQIIFLDKYMNKLDNLKKLCNLVRYDIFTSTTHAGSGHPTSSLSAVELMTVLFFGGFLRLDIENPKNLANDRVIFSKGHASPLLYSLFHASGAINYQDLLKLRKIDSPLEGHPTPSFPFVDVATGSLGQGLSCGLGMALGVKLNIDFHSQETEHLPNIYVLLGDSEMAEGQIWEAIQIASFYKLNNLIGILDVNRLGQTGETMLGWNTQAYEKRISSFGWNTVVVNNGNDVGQVYRAFEDIKDNNDKPVMIIAKTVKGKGVSFMEDKENWHGKVLLKEELKQALDEIQKDEKVDVNTKEKIIKPRSSFFINSKGQEEYEGLNCNYNQETSTREAYGDALVSLGEINPRVVVLDAETSNSTYSIKFKEKFKNRFFEMFIAEQNMISTACGLSSQGYIPFVSSFSAFLTRGFDQMRMAQYSNSNIKITGSHAGVSIGEDGPSQMGLEDLAMARSLLKSTVFYPSDAVSTVKLVNLMSLTNGLFYMRTTRGKTPILYSPHDEFKIGGSKIIYESRQDNAVIFAAGITLHQAIEAYNKLKKEGINICVVDLYSVKPIDKKTINALTLKIKNIIVVEDHYPYGGLGEAVLSSLSSSNLKEYNFRHLCVNKLPKSGTPKELLEYEDINADSIADAVKSFT